MSSIYRHLHAIHRCVCYDDNNLHVTDSTTAEARSVRLAIESPAAVSLVVPGDTAHLIDFDNKLPDLAVGFTSICTTMPARMPWCRGGTAGDFRFRLKLNAPAEHAS